MIYTSGIRKILTCGPYSCSTKEEAICVANTLGYNAIFFDGRIHVRVNDSLTNWTSTPFNITDFEAR